MAPNGTSNGDKASHEFDHPALQPVPLKIIIIGAGASGLVMAYKLQRNFVGIQLVVYEKNAGVGGTWWENRYPGCACDNFSHSYTFSFEPRPNWSRTFAPAAEIKEYFTDFSHKHGLDRYIRFASQVSKCVWNRDRAKWQVELVDKTTNSVIHDEGDVLINAGGILNAWKWPDVPGLKDFGGKLMHSAAWDEEVDLTGKRVALVGNGSSGIQILPSILPQVKNVVSFIRNPTWITTPFGTNAPRPFTPEEIRKFETDPQALLQMRKELENFSNRLFPIWLKGSEQQKEAVATFTKMMADTLNDESLAKRLIPQFAIGCRRLTPGVGYLEALKHPKTEIVHEGLAKVTKTGVVSASGKEFECDVLICATGFDTTFKPRFPIVGPATKDLRDIWAKEPRGYLGIAVPDFPNYFTFLGPNCPIGNGPVLIAIEGQADYMCKFINRLQTEGIRTVSPKMEVVDEFMQRKDRFFKTTVWDDGCNSWYKQGDKVTALWVGSTVHYLRTLEQPRYEDYNFTYTDDNRWHYLGNGFGPDDADPEADLSWYISNGDNSPIIGTKHRKLAGHEGGEKYGVIGNYTYSFLDN